MTSLKLSEMKFLMVRVFCHRHYYLGFKLWEKMHSSLSLSLKLFFFMLKVVVKWLFGPFVSLDGIANSPGRV